MTKENKNYVFAFVVVVVIAIIVIVVIKKIKAAASDLVSNTNDAVADSALGDLIGARTVAAKGAFAKLMKMNFLKHTWITRANAIYNKAPYTIPVYLTTQQATDYARELKKSQSTISIDFFNDNNSALGTIMSLKSRVQAAQVADAYYNIGNHKDLNRGLAWMSNEALVEAANYFESLPTGVFLDGRQLDPKDLIS